MNILAMLIVFVFLFVAVLVALWVGVYVVLPIALLVAVVSAIGSLVKAFMPQKGRANSTRHVQKNKENQIIDVEFEEIK